MGTFNGHNTEVIIFVHEEATRIRRLFGALEEATSYTSETGTDEERLAKGDVALRNIRHDVEESSTYAQLSDEGLYEVWFQFGLKRLFEAPMRNLYSKLKEHQVQWFQPIHAFIEEDGTYTEQAAALLPSEAATALCAALEEVERSLLSWIDSQGNGELDGTFRKDALKDIVRFINEN